MYKIQCSENYAVYRRVVHITTFFEISIDTLGIIEDRSKKFADFFWEVLGVIFIADLHAGA